MMNICFIYGLHAEYLGLHGEYVFFSFFGIWFTYGYSLDNYKLYPLVLVNHNDLSATSLGSMVYLRKLIPFYLWPSFKLVNYHNLPLINPLVMTNVAAEAMAIEIVMKFPMKHGDFP